MERRQTIYGPQGLKSNEFPRFPYCFSHILDRTLQKSLTWNQLKNQAVKKNHHHHQKLQKKSVAPGKSLGKRWPMRTENPLHSNSNRKTTTSPSPEVSVGLNQEWSSTPTPRKQEVALASPHPVTLTRPSWGLSAGPRGERSLQPHLTATGGKRQNEVVGNSTPLSPPTHSGVNQQESELTSPLGGKEVVQVEVAASQGPTFTRAKGKLSYHLTCLQRDTVNSALLLPEWC